MVKDTIKKKLHWGGSQKLLDRKCRARCRLEYHRRSDAGETKTQTMLSLARRHNCCQNTIKRALINRYAIPDNLDSDGDYASDIESDDSVGSNEFRFRETQSPKASSPVDEVSKTRPYHGMNLAAEAENRTHHDRVNFRLPEASGMPEASSSRRTTNFSIRTNPARYATLTASKTRSSALLHATPCAYIGKKRTVQIMSPQLSFGKFLASLRLDHLAGKFELRGFHSSSDLKTFRLHPLRTHERVLNMFLEVGDINFSEYGILHAAFTRQY